MLVAGLASLLCALTTARAQTIRGVVVDAANQPISGVVVFMVDSGSNVVARALSSDAGEFRVAATRPGSYRLRTMRIGYRALTTAAVALASGAEVTRRISLTGARVQLDTVRVVDRSSCNVANDASAAATFAVLEQARTALSAAQLTQSGRSITATTLSYTRELEPDRRRVLHQSSQLRTDVVAQPWLARSPAEAHRSGFVDVAPDNSVTYFAPSIEVLLSEEFLEDHCFRLSNAKREPASVGVAFEPASARRKVPEVRGTLWLDRKTAELRKLEYRYVNITSEQEDAGAGGDVSFARLANGGWVISRWDIRMPVLEQVVRSLALGGTQVHVAGIQVVGGEIVLATRGTDLHRDTLWSRPPLVLRGTVVDSATSQPIPKTRVDIVAAGLSATADARGRFAIAGVLPGTYVIDARTPEFDAIGATNQTTIVFDDSTMRPEIRVPKVAQLAASLCAGRPLSADAAAIVGRIFQRGDTVPATGARVLAEWTVLNVAEGGSHLERNGRRLEGKSAADGTFRLCGVPRNTIITITASGATGGGTRNVRPTGMVARVDVVMDRDVATTATFTGTVLADSTRTPIEGAEVYLPDLSKVGRSSGGGAFRLNEIPPGRQHVIVRHVGFAPLDTALDFRADQMFDRKIYLSRVATLDSVIVTDRLTDRIMRDFEDNRRIGLGTFLDRAELGKRTAQKVSQMIAQWPGVALVGGTGGYVWPVGTRNGRPPCPPLGAVAAACFRSYGYYVAGRSEPGHPPIACYAKVYVDDALMNHGFPTPPFEVNNWFAEQLEGIEWYPSLSTTPSRYVDRDAKCGVLVLHTRRTP
jgi:hypothetical protein